MTGYGHVITGTAITLAVLSFVAEPLPEIFLGPLLVGAIAAILPDIDAENSLLQHMIGNYGNTPIANMLVSRREQKTLLGGLLFATFSILELFVRALFIAVVGMLRLFVIHRGLTHYLLTALGLLVTFSSLSWLFQIPQLYPFAFFIGYIVHIAGDMMTLSGVRVFMPLSSQNYYLLPQRFRFRVERQMALPELIVVVSVSLVGFFLTTLNWNIPLLVSSKTNPNSKIFG